MRNALIILFITLHVSLGVAQIHQRPDSLRTPSSPVTNIRSLGNVTYSIPPTVETEASEIMRLEVEEGFALKNHDTTALRRLWAQNFSRDLSWVPHYLILYRTIEKVNIVGDLAFASGYETIQELDENPPLGFKTESNDPSKRNYKHVWAREGGGWILISMGYE